ncbi:hypothetical protein KFK09_019585 [Dendrobium nobile]|uniref:Uncharacterized protein n=1 Tax=Dendrobium nobile TaxID=94219 RepID=A0A8T3ARG3_DENNO|nr:hypothetical protein KFK09_019581 [Dendrobium nobile]KAI0498695.1 hypothetical protein KFK09_019585 [Dendrobium nobile]
MTNHTRFTHGALPLKYLGVPLFKGKIKAFLFNDSISLIQNRLFSWNSSFLSYGGHLTLIKSVLCSLPVYSFQTLLPTKGVCLRIERILNKFFWNGSRSNSKIHWKNWKDYCGIKQEGGLGCKNMTDLARAFSWKLWYNLRSIDSLWANFMKVKYCGGKHPSLSFYSKGNSKVWQCIYLVKGMLEPLLTWGLGKGEIFF